MLDQSSRISWDEYFIKLCNFVAERSTCSRRHVGAVLTRDNRVLATGYNGALSGQPHCEEVNHEMEDNHCTVAVHGEINVIALAARMGIPTEGTKLYINTHPCWPCFQVIIAAGIKEVVYEDEYNSRYYDKVKRVAKTIPGFTFRQFRKE